jgi:hypothetical protein
MGSGVTMTSASTIARPIPRLPPVTRIAPIT